MRTLHEISQLFVSTVTRNLYLYHRFSQHIATPKIFWTDTVGLAAFAVLGARIAACLPGYHVHAGMGLGGLCNLCQDGGLEEDLERVSQVMRNRDFWGVRVHVYCI